MVTISAYHKTVKTGCRVSIVDFQSSPVTLTAPIGQVD